MRKNGNEGPDCLSCCHCCLWLKIQFWPKLTEQQTESDTPPPCFPSEEEEAELQEEEEEEEGGRGEWAGGRKGSGGVARRNGFYCTAGYRCRKRTAKG